MKKSIIILGIALIFGSCTRENYNIETNENAENIASFEDYFKLVQSDTKAALLVGSVSSIESSENIFNISSVIKGNNEPYEITLKNQLFKPLNKEKFKSEKVSSWSSYNSRLSSFFGESLKIDLYGTI